MRKIFFIVIFLALSLNTVYAQQANLETEINSRTEELKRIHQQIEQTQAQLFEAESKKRSLGQDISRSNYTINQLNLTIKSSKINIEKLKLEINSLDLNIEDAQKQIELKRQAIYDILRELQIRDNVSIVETLLKNQSLAEGLTEVQNLSELRNSLSEDIDRLKNLKLSLKDQFTQVSTKKTGVEQESKASTVKKSLLEEERQNNKELLALTASQAEAYGKLVDNLAQRQEEIAREIEDLEFELRKQINTNLLPEPRHGLLAWPVDGYRLITQGYGATSFARYAYKGKWHNGIDVGAPIGAPLLSTGEGIVVNIGDQDKYCRKGAYGKYIVIRRPDNLVTMYAHLSQIAVSPGDKVGRGEVIGYIGSTGYSTGPHLHFTVYDGNTFEMRPSNSCGPMPSGGDLDPNLYL